MVATGPMGWICPRCQNVYAPSVQGCGNCNGPLGPVPVFPDYLGDKWRDKPAREWPTAPRVSFEDWKDAGGPIGSEFDEWRRGLLARKWPSAPVSFGGVAQQVPSINYECARMVREHLSELVADASVRAFGSGAAVVVDVVALGPFGSVTFEHVPTEDVLRLPAPECCGVDWAHGEG
jgi:hypothetical protein